MCCLAQTAVSLSRKNLILPSSACSTLFPTARASQGQGLAGGGSLQEVEERERRGWRGVAGLVPGTWENGVSFRLPTSVNPHCLLTFLPDLSPGNWGDQKAAPNAGLPRWVEDEQLRCWECARILGWSLLEVELVLRCKLGFKGYQASGSSFRGGFFFPTLERLPTLSRLPLLLCICRHPPPPVGLDALEFQVSQST